MKKSLIALAFGTLALGIAEFVMMGILAGHSVRPARQHRRKRTPDLGLRAGRMSRRPDADPGPQTPIETHPAGTGSRHHGRKRLCGPRPEFMDADGGSVCLGTAAQRLFRGRFDRRRKTGGRGKAPKRARLRA